MTVLEGLEDGDWYFINSDAVTLGHSPHDLWMATGMAFSGGAREPYGERLAALKPGDTLLLWANQLGVVAVGRVLEPWDGRAYREHRIVYRSPCDDDEYRLRTQWLLDLRAAPLTRKNFGYNPMQSLQRVSEEKKRAVIEVVRRAPFVLMRPAATEAVVSEHDAGDDPGHEHVEGAISVHISNRYERGASAARRPRMDADVTEIRWARMRAHKQPVKSMHVCPSFTHPASSPQNEEHLLPQGRVDPYSRPVVGAPARRAEDPLGGPRRGFTRPPPHTSGQLCAPRPRPKLPAGRLTSPVCPISGAWLVWGVPTQFVPPLV